VIKDVRHHEFIPHLVAMDLPFEVVHIIRDPRAAISSWIENPKEFPRDADPLANWRTGAVRKINASEYWGFNDWLRLTRMYLKLAEEHPGKVHVVGYEQLIDDPFTGTKALFDELRLPYTSQTEDFLRSSRSKNSADPFSVFKDPSVKGTWREKLDPSIRQAIEQELQGTDLERFLGA
jgi:hypothetical protein